MKNEMKEYLSHPLFGTSIGGTTLVLSIFHWLPLTVAILTGFIGLIASMYSLLCNIRKARAEKLHIEFLKQEINEVHARTMSNYICAKTPNCPNRTPFHQFK